MKRGILLIALVATLTGCGTEYTREIQAAEPFEDHRFVRIGFAQTGHRNSMVFETYNWYPVSGFVLLADDGWRLVVHGPSTTGYNWSPDNRRRADPVHFLAGTDERLAMIDPEGRTHPVRATVGAPSPRPPHVTIRDQPATATPPGAMQPQTTRKHGNR